MSRIYWSMIGEKRAGIAGLIGYPISGLLFSDVREIAVVCGITCVSYHILMHHNYQKTANYLLHNHKNLKPFIGKKFRLIDDHTIEFFEPSFRNFYLPVFRESIDYRDLGVQNAQNSKLYIEMNEEQRNFVDSVRFNRKIRARFMISSILFSTIISPLHISLFPLIYFSFIGIRYMIVIMKTPHKDIFSSNYPYFYINRYNNVVFTDQLIGFRKRYSIN